MPHNERDSATQEKLAPTAIESNRPVFSHVLRVWLERHLEKSGLSGVELERESGLPWTTIERILKGKLKRPPDKTSLTKLAGVFGVPVPQVYTAVDLGGAQKERDALDWLGEARAAIDAAERHLRNPPTAPLEDPARLVAADTAARKVRGKPGRRPDGGKGDQEAS